MNSTLKRLISQRSFIASIIILALVVGLALFSLTYGSYNPYNPNNFDKYTPYSLPSWVTIFPQYKNLPRTVHETLTPVSVSGASKINSTTYKIVVPPNSVKYVNFTVYWGYDSPSSFSISDNIFPNVSSNQLFFINMTWSISKSTSEYTILSDAPSTQESTIFASDVGFININKWDSVSFSSKTPPPSPFASTLSLEQQLFVNHILIPGAGTYRMSLLFINNSTKPESFVFTLPTFSTLGEVYGILGTDDNGVPVFPEFAIGARFDLEIALIASILIVFIGAVFGIVSGYFGGKVDTSIIGITDFFLLLPGLPLLITLEIIIVKLGINIPTIDLIIILISVLSWPATTRVVRSQTLSLRSRTFVEASKTLGLSNRQIMIKHILPNLIPIIAAQIAYDVPTVILIESGLDFLGLGITSFPTWGNMLGFASKAISSANGFAWWWILPPGIGIILLSVAFYYLGNAFINTFTTRKIGE
ncbi:ABC transporter permease subunit [Acidianus sulfidivorans JP7]|uniref:ABC transporter permease n=1 Tax=Acidianus sulfidivorans JP7 TaxID=619593 RepID=A0A2U9ILJ2_9CREN|nr:ABC transporter permease [Acidianus sulfidivorans]AWR96892.1 ABC transporter permease subunit [Acidianus sulfidivorans JP7]